MADLIKVLLAVFVGLFPVVNPVGCAPIFFSLAQRYPRSAQRILSRKIAIYSFALLVISFLFGSIILSFFGISLVVIQIAGGLIVAATGWNLLNQKDDAMFLLSVLVLLCYANANRMVRLPGTSGTSILTRLSAFILFAIGVQILWNGLSAGIPQMLASSPH